MVQRELLRLTLSLGTNLEEFEIKTEGDPTCNTLTTSTSKNIHKGNQAKNDEVSNETNDTKQM